MAIVYLLCRPPTCPEFPENPEIFAVSLTAMPYMEVSGGCLKRATDCKGTCHTFTRQLDLRLRIADAMGN
jgi:hypothetical protein